MIIYNTNNKLNHSHNKYKKESLSKLIHRKGIRVSTSKKKLKEANATYLKSLGFKLKAV